MKKHKPASTILIGGAPAIGKSTVARVVARALHIDYMSADNMRRIIRAVTTRESHPGLHFFLSKNPEDYFFDHAYKEFISHVETEAREVAPVVKKFVHDNPAVVKRGVLIEGVNLMPMQLAQIKKYVRDVKVAVLYAKSKRTVSRSVQTRGLWAKTAKAKAMEIEYLWELNNHIKRSAKELGIHAFAVEPYRTLKHRMLDWAR